jgi:hypothetical protein
VAELEKNSWAGQAKKKRKKIGPEHIISLHMSQSNFSISIAYNLHRLQYQEMPT